jgi:hypothetical protein
LGFWGLYLDFLTIACAFQSQLKTAGNGPFIRQLGAKSNGSPGEAASEEWLSSLKRLHLPRDRDLEPFANIAPVIKSPIPRRACRAPGIGYDVLASHP